MTRVLVAALAAGFGAALAWCRPHAADPSPPQAIEAVASYGDASAPDASRAGLERARCSPRDCSLSLGKEGADDVDLGDGIASGDGRYAVGLVHRTASGRTAAVVLLDGDAAAARVVDLGRTLGDAPPPQLAACEGRLFAAAFRVPDRPAAPPLPPTAAVAAPEPKTDPAAHQDLALYALDSADPTKPSLSIPQHRDDSLAFDVACAPGAGLVVWDEVVAATVHSAARGVIRAVPIHTAPAIRADAILDVSPPESDAEMPRVVAEDRGFFVLWIARREEAPEDAAAVPAPIEATGEARSHGWLEMVAVDASGHPAGPVRRLTSASGHVGAYDVEAHVEGGKPVVLVVARDDGESVDGAGGTLWRVRVHDTVADPPVEVPTDGLGRGAPSFVDSPAGWLTWVGGQEQLRLLPLDVKGGAAAPASIESALDDMRPLFSIRPPTSAAGTRDAVRDAPEAPAEARLLASAPADTRCALRVFSCRK